MIKKVSIVERKLPKYMNSILYLVIFAFLLNLVPLYGLTTFFYRRAYNTVENMTTSTITDNQQYLMNELYNRIYGLWQSLYNTENSRGALITSIDAVKAYSFSEILSAKLEVLNNIKNIAAGQDIIDDICVYFTSARKSVRLMEGIGDMSGSDMEWLLGIEPEKNKLLMFYDDGIYLIPTLVSHSYTKKADSLPLVVAMAKISPDKVLNRIMSQSNEQKYSDIFLLRTHDSKILASNLGAMEESEILEYISSDNIGKSGKGFIRTEIKNNKYFLFYCSSSQLGLTFYELIPSEYILGEIDALEQWYVLGMTALICITLFLIYCIYAMIFRPANVLKASFYRSEQGELGVTLPLTRLPYEYEQMYRAFNSMTRGIKHMVERDYSQQILLQEAVIKQLQFQINPHFLYNSFFILNSMLRNEDYESAEEMSKLLGTFFEYITKDKETMVPLSAEIEHARAYSNIQMLRFGRRIRVNYMDLPPELDAIRVPKLILQPLIENAFQHGVHDILENGLISITFEYDGYIVYIHVNDNGKHITDAEISRIRNCIDSHSPGTEGIALSNIQKRLDVRYGMKSGLYLSRSDLGGLCVTIRIAADSKEGN